jgi:hypothetical protein
MQTFYILILVWNFAAGTHDIGVFKTLGECLDAGKLAEAGAKKINRPNPMRWSCDELDVTQSKGVISVTTPDDWYLNLKRSGVQFP